jgi:hypothetical protein
LRPTAAIQPYIVNACAEWLASLGKFQTSLMAANWLRYLEKHYPFRFKALISQYHEIHDYSHPFYGVNDLGMEYRTSHNGPYGEDAHMYWHMHV